MNQKIVVTTQVAELCVDPPHLKIRKRLRI